LWNIGANDFTAELWANFAAPVGGSIEEPGSIFIGNDDGPGYVNKWFFGLGGGVLEFVVYNTADPLPFPDFYLVQAPFTPVVGEWYHLAVTKSGTLYTIYVNGVAVGSQTSTPPIGTPVAPLTIGQAENIGFMNGSLDEVTVYNRALLPGEIQAIYNAASSGKCISLQISPSAGGDTGNVSVNINGIGFQPGATVSLAMTGQTSIVGNPVTVGASGTNIATTFNLAGQTDGAWDVVVTNPDGTSFKLPQGFTIQLGTGPQVWVDVVGIGLIVPGRAQAFQVFYGNSGNVDTIGVPLWIAGIPPDATLSPGFNALPPLPLTDPTSEFSQVATSINTGTQIVGSFMIPVIPAGSTGALQVTVTVPELEDFQLQAWTNPSWFGSSPSTSAFPLVSKSDRQLISSLRSLEKPLDSAPPGGLASTGDLLGCVTGILDQLYFQSNPNTACVQSEFQAYEQFLTDEAELKTEGKFGLNDTVNTFWAIVHGAYQCAYAAACDACATPVAGEEIPESCLVCEAPRFLQDFNNAYSAYGTLNACKNVESSVVDAILPVHSIQSFDPNNKVGPQGFGTSQFLSGQQPLHYSVSFENDPTATAPAQQVVITDQLDPTKVDLTTLSLGPIAFGSNQVVPPLNSNTFATTVSLQPAQNLNVQVTGSLDPNSGLLTWIFASIDPTTGNPPTDPSVGFLPPDVTPPEGDGSVLFTVMPKQGLATGTQFTNQATIVFDTNAPISTPAWLNTLDVTPPVSTVSALPATEVANSGGSATFNVSWSGTDVGSGIATYTIYASDNGGPFTSWQTATTQTSASFTGTVGDTYGFYSIATDNVGNVEATKTVAEASTQVTVASPVTPTVTVTPSSSTITTVQSLLVTVSVSGGSGNPTPTGSVTLTGGGYTSAATSLASGTVTISVPAGSLAVGGYTLTASYTPDSSSSSTYNSASGTSVQVTVTQATQTIAFANPGAQTVGTSLTLSATATSGLAVSFTSTTASICTVSGTRATFIASGTCTIDANQAGNSIYAAAAMVPQSFTVNGEAQTITFPSIPAQTVGTPLTLSATATSGLAVSFTSATTGICTVSGTTATFIASGTCTIDANQAGNSIYAAATMVPESFTVNAAPGFTISASPTTLSVVQGGNETTTITVADVGGFSGTVSLTASGLPSGVAASFAAGSTAGTQVLTLTASTSATISSAPVTVTITGTSGNLGATTSIELTITAEPSFAPGSGGTTNLSVSPGATTGNTGIVSVVGTNGFSGTVSLTCAVTTAMTGVSDMPSCSLSPSSVTLSSTTPQTSTLTVNTTTASSAENQMKKLFWPSTGGTALALILLFCVPRRQRNWLAMLGLLVLFVSIGAVGCGGGGGGGGGGNVGTTPGTYTVTVAGTSGNITGTVGTVTLTVQ
jgi:hypothetical protein